MALIALVRPPTASIQDGERTYVDRQVIDFAKAQEQHISYVCALRDAGAQIVALPAIPDLPDAVFIEDAALVIGDVGVIARSGAPTRRAETPAVAAVLNRYCNLISLPDKAIFDGGDALVIDRTVYIGQTRRTNPAAVAFLTTLLHQNGYDVVPVPVSGCLHLKTAVTYLGNNTVLMNPNWIPARDFAKHAQFHVDTDEPMAANALLVGDRVFMSASYPVTLNHVMARGFNARALELNEFHKAEGGLTCLSIILQVPNAI